MQKIKILLQSILWFYNWKFIYQCVMCDEKLWQFTNIKKHFKTKHSDFDQKKTESNSASADGGPRSRVHARGTLCSAPNGTFGNFPAHVSAESFSPNFPFSGQNRVNLGCMGGTPNIFFIGFLIFVLLRSPCKIPKLKHKPF